MPGNRVGDPNALIKPGDPVPGKAGTYYEVGQFSPSIDTLSVMKLLEAQDAGVLPSKFDVYNDDGQVDTNKLKKINFTQDAMESYGIQLPSSTPPGVALIFLATLDILPEATVKYPGIFRVLFDINTQQVLGGELAQASANGEADGDQQAEVGGAISTVLSGFDFSTKPYSTYIHIYQPFYTYLSVPFIPRVANLTSGLSVSSYSLLNTVLKAVYNRMLYSHESLAYRFLEVAGWKEEHNILPAERANFEQAGRELGVERDSNWYRDTRVPMISMLSTVSPLESFAEGYVHYYLHRTFLKHVHPPYLEFYADLDAMMQSRVEKGLV